MNISNSWQFLARRFLLSSLSGLLAMALVCLLIDPETILVSGILVLVLLPVVLVYLLVEKWMNTTTMGMIFLYLGLNLPFVGACAFGFYSPEGGAMAKFLLGVYSVGAAAAYVALHWTARNERNGIFE